MSGVHRFLSKRDRDRSQSRKHHLGSRHNTDTWLIKDGKQSHPETAPKPPNPSSAADFYGLFDCPGKPAGAEESNVKALRQKLIGAKGVAIRDRAILWALRSQMGGGDIDAAYIFLLAMSDASEGMVRNYDPAVRLKGAQNRQGVTCFLDSTLFAMFARLESFEAMLYNDFSDLPRSKLSFLLRLWVNLLRSGQLITVDVTQVIQEAIAACGWEEAAKLHQQDASEAFTFITSKLELPLLTLKMDIYHTGKEDATDDHKFINERLLDVAIPEDPRGEKKEITLEDCLEDYFNNRIEVRRYLERRSTIGSTHSSDANEKGGSVHVEMVEVEPDSSPATPVSSSPMKSPYSRPATRDRTTSIIQERYIPARGESGYASLANVDTKGSNRSRAGSVRKEVMMPAWQFFSLIPWYTDNAPANDAQVAAHFSSKRPVLGLCLKRYAMRNGRAVRLNTKVDIPIEIGLPHFIQDDHMTDDGALFGSFKLSLQSVVCHRGNSVDSGHYVALVRGTTTTTSAEDSKHWMRFDDLAKQKITLIDIEKALEEETPYLLFYQIVPMDGDPGHITAGEKVGGTTIAAVDVQGGDVSTTSLSMSSTGPSSDRASFETPMREDPRGRPPAEERQPSNFLIPDAAATAKADVADTTSPKSSSPPGRISNNPSPTRRGTDDGPVKTPHKLAMRNSREQLPNSVGTNIQVREVTDADSIASERQPQIQHQQKHHTLTVGHTHKQHKRELSVNRLIKGSGKGKEHKPDRECLVM